MAERHTTTLDIKVDDREIARLGQEIERTFSVRSLEAFNDVLERQGKALATLIKQQEKLQQSIDNTRRKAEGSGGGPGGGQRPGAGGGQGGGGQGGMLERALSTALGTYLGQRVHGMMHHTPSFTQAVTGGEAVSAALEMLPIPGTNVVNSIIKSSMATYEEGLGAARARVGSFGKSGLSREAMQSLMNVGPGKLGIGVDLGMSDEEVSQRMAMFGRQTGMTGNKLAAAAPLMLGAQRLGGIESVGALMGGAGAAGGRTSAQRSDKLIKDTIGSGIIAGFREGKLDEYVQSVGAFTEQMRNQGILISPESVNELTRGISQGEAVKGKAGAQLTQNIMQGMKGGLDSPSLMTGVLMKVMKDQGLSWEEGRLALEKDPGKFAPLVMTEIERMMPGTDRKTLVRRGLLTEKVMSSAGITIGRQQGVDLATGLARGRGGARAAAEGFLGRREAGLEPQMEASRFEAKEDQIRKLMGGLDPDQREAMKLAMTVKAADIAVMKTTQPKLAAAVNAAIDKVKELADIMSPGKGKGKGREPLVPGRGRVDPDTGVPQITAEEEVMLRHDEKEFGAGVAAKNQAQRLRARKAKAKAAIDAGAKPFSEGGDPLGKRDERPALGGGAGGDMLRGATPLQEAASHAHAMANSLDKAAADEAEVIQWAKEEVAGGHD
jgi:hypothetical protein